MNSAHQSTNAHKTDFTKSVILHQITIKQMLTAAS